MWTCVTVVYLVAAAILTMRLLAPGNDSREKTPTPPDLRIAPTSQTDPRSLGVI
jgi:hypothetical protein